MGPYFLQFVRLAEAELRSLPPTAVPGPLQPVPAFRTADGLRPAAQEKESPRTSGAADEDLPPENNIEVCRTPSLRRRREEGDGATAPPAAARAQRFNHKYQNSNAQ
ncbi:unnamed protein product [Pleuronectes platessa]|uniref:Uncharacterized protein n=1 Tax=Pleuronectes platessa TaxID=8262 RepID=A0A9N7U2R7_PLEPL|nr:unnamed protein product [Pleuronectes platessa]